MTASLLFQQVLNGLAIGSVYAIFALGYTLIFSILRIINFTHGAIFTLGAYATYALTGASFGFNGLLAKAALPLHLPFVLALIGGSLFAAVCGVAVERLAFRPLRARGADPAAHAGVEPGRRGGPGERDPVPVRRGERIRTRPIRSGTCRARSISAPARNRSWCGRCR